MVTFNDNLFALLDDLKEKPGRLPVSGCG